MNVRCDSCGTVYRVDPEKVPARGIQARCAVCASIINVAAESAPVLATEPQAPTPRPQGEATPAASRPSAPVFTPTPGTPLRQPHPVAQPQPAAPIAATAPRPASRVAPTATPKAPGNPFLERNPQQKARRLARALISDMIVYQPDKRQKSLDSGTLKEDFGEEIKKSWQEYVGQIGDEVANSNNYFNEALNEILAGGQQIF